MKKGLFISFLLLVITFIYGYMSSTISISSGAAIGLFLWVLIFSVYRRHARKKQIEEISVPSLSKTKETHYQQFNMNEREITFFRETMGTAKHQIVQLQKNMGASSKLRAIDLRNDTTKISKAFFKALVKEPLKLHMANHFLYTHLPNLVDLTAKHLEIEQHEVKSKETYQKLEESAQIIDQMAKLITKDYQEFVADDFDEMDVEISIAKNNINDDN